jgi:hypothetical protein
MSFKFNVNLTGAGERKGPSGAAIPVTGPYKVELVTEPKLYTKQGESDPSSLLFDCTVADGGEFDGYVAKIYIGLDFSKEGNRRGLRTALLSSGYSPDQIDGGEIEISPELFTGKSAHIFIQAGDPNDKTSQTSKYFITPEGYERLKAQAATAPAAGANTVTVTGTATMKPAAAPVVTPAAAVAAKPKVGGGLKAMLGK